METVKIWNEMTREIVHGTWTEKKGKKGIHKGDTQKETKTLDILGIRHNKRHKTKDEG